MKSIELLEKLVEHIKKDINNLKCCGNCKNNNINKCRYNPIQPYMKKHKLNFKSHFVCNGWKSDDKEKNDRLFLNEELQEIE